MDTDFYHADECFFEHELNEYNESCPPDPLTNGK